MLVAAVRTNRFLSGTRREQLILLLGLANRCCSPLMPALPIARTLRKGLFYKVLLVPVERIELPTFGLQNHCATAELELTG